MLLLSRSSNSWRCWQRWSCLRPSLGTEPRALQGGNPESYRLERNKPCSSRKPNNCPAVTLSPAKAQPSVFCRFSSLRAFHHLPQHQRFSSPLTPRSRVCPRPFLSSTGSRHKLTYSPTAWEDARQWKKKKCRLTPPPTPPKKPLTTNKHTDCREGSVPSHSTLLHHPCCLPVRVPHSGAELQEPPTSRSRCTPGQGWETRAEQPLAAPSRPVAEPPGLRTWPVEMGAPGGRVQGGWRGFSPGSQTRRKHRTTSAAATGTA